MRRARRGLRVLVRGEDAVPRRPSVRSLTPEEVQEARSFFPMEKFFIFGHARSGTTLLARLIRLHPEVHCNWQAHFFTRPPLITSLVADPAVSSWLSRKDNRWNRGSDPSPVVLRAVCDYLMERDARRGGKRIVGDKSPSTLMGSEAVALMHAFYPDARLIVIVRDGRDTVLSHRFQTFVDRPELLSKAEVTLREDYRRHPDGYGRTGRSLFTEMALRSAADVWAGNVADTDREGKRLFGEHYRSLRYEDLLADPIGQTTALWAFLGAQGCSPELETQLRMELSVNPDAAWQQQKEADLTRDFRKGVAGGWTAFFTERDKRVFKEAAAQTLMAWGYEKDSDW